MLVHDYVQQIVLAMPKNRLLDIRFSEGNNNTFIDIAQRESKPMREPKYFIRHAEAKVYAPQPGAERVLVVLALRHFNVDKTQPAEGLKRFKMTNHGKFEYDLTEDMDVLVHAALAFVLEGKLPPQPKLR